MRRRHFISTLTLALAGLGSALQPAITVAQSNSGTLDPAIVFARLLKILDKAGTIIPGEGFKSIKIGDAFEKLIRLWGPPRNIRADGTLSYLLSGKIAIHFLGDKEIESIIVQGKVGALARVNNGVFFGMKPAQAAARFKVKPDKVTRSRLLYSSIGIELGFGKRGLQEIKVFEP